MRLPTRLVIQEKEVLTKICTAGVVRMYSPSAYRTAFGRDGGEDGLVAESWRPPTGESSIQVFKASVLPGNFVCHFDRQSVPSRAIERRSMHAACPGDCCTHMTFHFGNKSVHVEVVGSIGFIF